MDTVKQLIDSLRDRCTTDQLYRIELIERSDNYIWRTVKNLYKVTLYGQSKGDGYDKCRYKLYFTGGTDCIGCIENYFDDLRLVKATYKLDCLKEELSLDVSYDSIEQVEHMKSVIIGKLYENLTVAKIEMM